MRKTLIAILFCCAAISVMSASVICQTRPKKPVSPEPKIISTTEPATPQQSSEKDESATADVELLIKIKGAEAESALYTIDPDKYKDKAGSPAKLAELYQQAIRRPAVLKSLAGEVYADFIANKSGARGAAQVSQLADEAGMKIQMIIMAQNQRIIELLEQLVRKR